LPVKYCHSPTTTTTPRTKLQNCSWVEIQGGIFTGNLGTKLPRNFSSGRKFLLLAGNLSSVRKLFNKLLHLRRISIPICRFTEANA